MTEAESQEAESQTQDGQAQDDAGAPPIADSPEPGLVGGFVEDFVGDFERRYPVHILETLLADHTTGRNIIWADNEYEALGDGYMGDDEITVDEISGANSGVIKPRITKEAERQSQRTKSRAEVFTPSWLCNQMNNDLDEVWFGRRDVFNTEVTGEDGRKAWTPAAEPVAFPAAEGRDWRAYVAAPRLEITCGEAPFICSRYDTVTGQALPVGERIGFLDRKLRVVSEKTKKRNTWVEQALAALKATYGFEYQGDNLLIARINVFETFCEHLRERWGEEPTKEELEQAAQVVSWNLWQMDGFTDAVPTHELGAVAQSVLAPEQPAPVQGTLFDLDLDGDVFADFAPPGAEARGVAATVPLCVLYDWKSDRPFEFAALKERSTAMTAQHSTAQHSTAQHSTAQRRFYAVIGNPPYQISNTDSDSGNKTYAAPIYHEFMDAAYEVGEKVELITPARFLFDAGSTPKAWNQKMLNDTHLKVLDYAENATEVFPNTDIKGGVAVTLRDARTSYGSVKVFTKYNELNQILNRVRSSKRFQGLDQIVVSRTAYRLTDQLHRDYPFARYREDAHGNNVGRLSQGHDFDMSTNIFDCLPEVFHDEKPQDGASYIRILGREGNTRVYKFVKASYVNDPLPLNSYSIVLPKASGTGEFGEVISQPVLSAPGTGTTESFISVGYFKSQTEGANCLKYISTKFARALLGVLKITQDFTPKKWAYVPLQDFTPSSDIDWSQSVAGIDRQLYAKYGLSNEEIEFIESHVKEMD